MDKSTRYLMGKYARAIVHMREQIRFKRFGLVFGSGITQDLGFPSWDELVKRIGRDKRIKGNRICKKASVNTSVSQLLFQCYRSNVLKSERQESDKYDGLNSRIQSGWHEIIHDALYKNVPSKISGLKSRDKYLKEYLGIIKKTKLTVNYNFDDTLQTLLSEHSHNKEDEERGFRTIWSSDIQLYPQDGVIYHPNGFLPRNFEERPSDDLIFLEGAFGDQLMESVSGHYMALSYHFSQNTCLFMGISLNDSTLKHLLRMNAILHPGHVHYYIHFLDDINKLDEEHRRAIRDANFEVYNLVTLFLDRKGIAKLGKLLRMDNDNKKIELLADELGIPIVYRYFLSGSVSVGKSTAISHFRSLHTHDEWLDKRAPGMEIDPSKVKEKTTIDNIDNWVAKQWHVKNFILSNAKPGVHIIDRCPLDAFAFTPEEEWINKAKFTKNTITPARSQITLCKGKVILMIGDPTIMSVRAIKIKKVMPVEKLEERQNMFRIIYDSNIPGIEEIDTCNKSVKRVVKEICRIIHIDDYEECDLQNRLDLILKGKVHPSSLHEKKREVN